MPNTREKLIELLQNAPHLDVVKGYKGTDCTFEQGADWLIANGVTFDKDINAPIKWISVKERLPDNENQRVLAVCIGDYPIGHPRIDTDRYTRGHWVRYGNDVTHWTPLPEPPTTCHMTREQQPKGE